MKLWEFKFPNFLNQPQNFATDSFYFQKIVSKVEDKVEESLNRNRGQIEQKTSERISSLLRSYGMGNNFLQLFVNEVNKIA